MTTIILLMLGGGLVLVISAIEGTSIVQTIKDVWSGQVSNYDWKGTGSSKGSSGKGSSGKGSSGNNPPPPRPGPR